VVATGWQLRRLRWKLVAVTRKKLAILLCITFVLLSTVYLGAVALGGGPIEPVIFLALAGF
jgi:hypothetical protein